MIEDFVDTVIVAWLKATTTGLNIVRGLETENPLLSLPALVVYSRYEWIPAQDPLYKCNVTLEYKSIPDEYAAANVQADMAQIDTAIRTQPSGAVIATLPLTGIKEFQLQEIQSTQQEVVTDRRTNTREIVVILGI